MANSPKTALVVVDMLNSYEHDDAEQLTESVETIVDPLADLIARADRDDTEIIYVNDNYDDWNSSQEELTRRALDGARRDLVEPILPPDGADFVLKARHTIFYMTPLEYLLGQRDIDRLILTGQVTEQCILYSALDAYVRHFDVAVPRDGVAHIHENLATAALEMMERNMGAEITSCAEL
ncbi:MAG TPA: isochorismatase family cysteine hydrolase [Thermoleophilaceae bacterium]|nr:isochorismatase family cysteine hydrolase [Thermoleophilaceae bacterium]